MGFEGMEVSDATDFVGDWISGMFTKEFRWFV